MMEFDAKEKKPLDECQGRGMIITNYDPKYEQETNSIKEDSTVEYNLTQEPNQCQHNAPGYACSSQICFDF